MVLFSVLSSSEKSEFSEVYEEHVWGVYGFCAYHALNREDAEDLTQLTFERALRAWGRYDPKRATPRTWLLAIARNLIIDQSRRGRTTREVAVAEMESVEEAAGASEPPHARTLGLDPELEAGLRNLDERQRELIALRFGGDLSGREIAELTELSLANVQQIISRALRQLRDQLQAGGAPPD